MEDADINLQTEPKANIANVIGEKLSESIKNLDVMSMLQRMIDQPAEDDETEGVQQKLKDVIDKYNSMSDLERVEFTSKMKEALASKIAVKLKDPGALDLSGFEDAIQSAVKYQLMLIGGAFILFIILLVFFGYKLYKSIKEKEIKREEKKKAKQMKKKK